MPTLYTLSENNIRKTWVYMIGFFLFVILIGFIFAQASGQPEILYFAIAVALIMNIISYYYSDKIVLAMYEAKEADRKNNPELYRIVENLTMSAGLPMPKIYIINEAQPNAFATGRSPNHAVIVFTQGIIELLDKRELEGVTAHELSHIGNRDILISTIAVILAGFVAIIADIFLRISFWGGRNRNRNQNPIIFVIALVGALLAPIAATLIRLAISRKREFLADSTGALLTRDPEGLASALEKLERSQQPLNKVNHATAHLFIVNPLKENQDDEQNISWIAKLFMTHPPIKERIKILRKMSI